MHFLNSSIFILHSTFIGNLHKTLSCNNTVISLHIAVAVPSFEFCHDCIISFDDLERVDGCDRRRKSYSSSFEVYAVTCLKAQFCMHKAYLLLLLFTL